jgi:hypothetical protein
MDFQAAIVFAIRLTGDVYDVSIRDRSSDLLYAGSIRLSDHTNPKELMAVEGYKPPLVHVQPLQADCAGWATAALKYAGLDTTWAIDGGGVRQGHVWQAGGWVYIASPAFKPCAFPLKYMGGDYYRPGVVNTTGVRTDYWIVVQPA